MAALSGSGTPPVRYLELYGTISDYLLLLDIGSQPSWELKTIVLWGSGLCWLDFGGCLF